MGCIAAIRALRKARCKGIGGAFQVITFAPYYRRRIHVDPLPLGSGVVRRKQRLQRRLDIAGVPRPGDPIRHAELCRLDQCVHRVGALE